jgi:hypothetical protein
MTRSYINTALAANLEASAAAHTANDARCAAAMEIVRNSDKTNTEILDECMAIHEAHEARRKLIVMDYMTADSELRARLNAA